jgi:hypothetical protein
MITAAREKQSPPESKTRGALLVSRTTLYAPSAMNMV